MEERFKLIKYSNQYYDELKKLIHDGWAPNHVFLQSDALLKWQYEGYGALKGKGPILMLDGDRLIGFRLFIPIEIHQCDDEGVSILPSVVSTLYFLKEEYRGQKLGFRMQQYIFDEIGNYFAIASNLKTSAPIHRKTGAYMIDKMYRYVLVLTSDADKLLSTDSSLSTFPLFTSTAQPASENAMKPAELETFWAHSIQGKNVTSLQRSADFWQWRYLDSPVYKYHFFGSEEQEGIVVGRVSNLFNPDKTLRSEKVFRILEIIPANKLVWNGVLDDKLVRLLESVNQWAKQHGCCLSEFYLSSSRFASCLQASQFIEVNLNADSKNAVMSYFEPCDPGTRLCNVTYWSQHYAGNFDFENTYFTLSDADQDRPNIII
jgi:hypothetical protein